MRRDNITSGLQANFFAIVFALIATAGCRTSPTITKTSAEEKSLGAPTMTVYSKPPVILQTEAQKRDAGVNSVVGWHAALDDAEGSDATTIGTCNGTIQVTRLEKDTEHRMTMIGFNWKESDDSLVAGGSQTYPSSPTETATPIIRGILGGTGRFISARGQVVSTRLPSGWYQHHIWLID